jgi:hypothetical protein
MRSRGLGSRKMRRLLNQEIGCRNPCGTPVPKSQPGRGRSRLLRARSPKKARQIGFSVLQKKVQLILKRKLARRIGMAKKARKRRLGLRLRQL